MGRTAFIARWLQSPHPGRGPQLRQGRPSKRQVSVLARSFDLRLGASAVAPRAGCQRARRDGNRRRPKRQQNRTQSASFLHAMLHARSLEFGPRASCPIDATVTRRLASKARKVRHGIPHGAFVRNIRHK